SACSAAHGALRIETRVRACLARLRCAGRIDAVVGSVSNVRFKRPFWQESDSTAMADEPTVVGADDARSRQCLIGSELRQWYDKIAAEPVPEEWLSFLERSDGNGRIE